VWSEHQVLIAAHHSLFYLVNSLSVAYSLFFPFIFFIIIFIYVDTGGFVQQMCTGRAPWRCMKLKGQFALFTYINESENESPLQLEERMEHAGLPFVSPDLRAFISRCFIRDYTQRPHAAELLSDPFFALSNDEDSDDELGQTTQGIEKLLEKKETADRVMPPLAPPAPRALPVIAETSPQVNEVKANKVPSQVSQPPGQASQPVAPPEKKASAEESNKSDSQASQPVSEDSSTDSGSKKPKRLNPFGKKKTKEPPPSEEFSAGQLDQSGDVVNVASINPREKSMEYAEVPKLKQDTKGVTFAEGAKGGGGSNQDEEEDAIYKPVDVNEMTSSFPDSDSEEDDDDEEEEEEKEVKEVTIEIANQMKKITATEYQLLLKMKIYTVCSIKTIFMVL
jgi:serine/threonine protein kinase